jgi:hypothetical protein
VQPNWRLTRKLKVLFLDDDPAVLKITGRMRIDRRAKRK